MLCYCDQIDLPVQLEIETLFIILALCWLSRLGLCLVSTCFFDPLFRSTCCSGNLRCCWVTSRGKPCWSTGLFNAGSVMLWRASWHCWFCDVKAFTKSLIHLDSLSQPMLRRESSGPASGSSLCELENDEKGEARENILSTGALFLNSPT